MLIKFPYNESLISQIKEIPGRKWDPKERGWSIPDQYLILAADALEDFYPTVSERVRIYAERLSPQTITINELSSALSPQELTSEVAIEALRSVRERLNLPYSLFPYQELGVAFLEETPYKGAIVADAPGLGKTIQTLAWMSLHTELRPVLIVVPASVKLNWAREIKKWLPSEQAQVIMTGKDTIDLEAGIYIINYELFWRKEETFKHIRPAITVFDECTYLKERKAKRTQAAIALGKRSKYVLGLSGTPIINRPMEFFNILNLINSDQFPNWFQFGKRYCDGQHNGYGWNFNGSSHLKELQSSIKPFMIRRKKEDVLKDLPPKRREFLDMELTGNIYSDYQATETEWMSTVQIIQTSQLNDNDSYINILAKLGLMRHILGRAKGEVAIEHIKNFTQGEEKLLVFGHHQDVLSIIEDSMKKANISYVRVDGSTPNQARQDAVDRFQTEEDCLVFLTSTAMGMGVTLTAASNALFVERQWSPSVEEQMEDRIHRIGQTKGVVIWYMQATNTIDELLANIVESKRQLLAELLDSGQKTNNKSMMKELMAEMSRG